ncbi:hypothetical protein CS542_04295 [Pedobacter sp. IW39]|nr:hypothetical protein CS542_04295 [Pedobacter sp. IW39]
MCRSKSSRNARQLFSEYFLVAILFVLFDVEVIFYVSMGCEFQRTWMAGLIEMFVFMATLLLALFGILKKALD